MSNGERRRRTTSLAAVAALTALAALAAPVHALDAQCQPIGASPYTGYVPVSGSECRQYVHCDDGVVSSWHGCPNELKFNGEVCTWATDVECNDPPAPAPTPPVPVPASAPTLGALLAQAAASSSSGSTGTTGSSSSGAPRGFCGRSLEDAKDKCHQPCQTSLDCCSPSEACFTTGTSCAGANLGGSDNNYCGLTWCQAAEKCAVPCPGGTDAECPGDQGCFADVPPCGFDKAEGQMISDEVMSFLNANAINSNAAPPNDASDPSSANAASSPSRTSRSSGGRCNLCKPGQAGINNPVILDGELTDCSFAYDFALKNYKEGDVNCVGAGEAFGSTCCRDVDAMGNVADGDRNGRNNDSSSGGVVNDNNSNNNDMSMMTNAVSPNNNGNPESYFCGTSPENARELCRPCPSGRMEDCGMDFTYGCFVGITSCSDRANAGTGEGGGGGGGTNANAGGQNSAAQTLNDSIADAIASSIEIGNALNENANDIVDQYMDATNNYETNRPMMNAPQQDGVASFMTNQPMMDDFAGGMSQQGNQASQAGQANQANQGGAAPTPAAVETQSPTMTPWTNAPFAPSPSSAPKTVIGYYASWQWYDRDKYADPQNIDFSKYDRINFAFFQPDPDGNLYGTDKWGDPQLLWGPYKDGGEERCSWDEPDDESPSGRNCKGHDTSKGLIRLAHDAGAEIMPSIGGWTLSDNFPGIAADGGKRDRFAEQCIQLIEEYGFDGIDIDWEYPGYADHSGTPEDTENFTKLLKAVRAKLDSLGSARNRIYGLTAALPCGPDKLEKIQIDKINEVLTELNLMSYDLHGAWDALTGINAPMFDQGWTDETKRWSVHGCVNTYFEQGVPLSKINIGLPFYGRSFQGATGMKQFHGGTDDINFHLDEGSPQYFNIVNELARMTTYRHEKTQTQYAVFNRGGGLVSYDDPRAICDKVAYANERGLHGFLIWEISGDMLDNGETPLIDAVNAKVRDPGLNCANLRDPTWALNDLTYNYAPDEPDSVDWSNYVAPTSTGSAYDYDGAQGGNGGERTPLDDCPVEFTGMYASGGCRGYVFCQDGEVVGASQPCAPGTLFDVTIGVCEWKLNVKGCGR